MKTTAGTEVKERCSHCNCNSTGGCAKCNPDLFKPISETFGIEYIKQKPKELNSNYGESAINKPKELDWEKEYKEYKDWCFYNKQHLGRMFDSEAFWDFYLKQTLQQQREEIIKEIEGIVEQRRFAISPVDEILKEIRERLKQFTNLKEK